MKDFERKLQTNVLGAESESCNHPTSKPASYAPSMEESHVKDAKESNINLILQVAKELQKQLEEKKVQEYPFMLVSGACKNIIKSYKEGEKINGVPLDKRRYGKMVFDDHIKKNLLPLNDKLGLRTPLLCNHGISGSGKTVQQALNMHWFTDR